ncbi:MAG: hypothetical protein CMO19_01090 [Thaumarchaeota archaeon]|nr:hypothetical protein [Nitrososphaerota archaeon]|tara:strand:+ start:1327 stop:2064 length:738 start_codon:yes stop_codon:yes gene_type:complete
MTDPLTLTGLVIVIGVLPILIGMYFRVLNNKSKSENIISKYALNNISLGIMFALFIDFIVNSSQLGINLGFNIYSITLLLCFIFGFTLLFLISTFTSNFSYIPILLLSLSFSFHSFAEGIVIGYDVNVLGISASIPRGIQTTSFVIHKIAEGFVIPLFYHLSFSYIAIFTLISGFPIILGSIFGLYGFPGILSSVFFSISSGALLFTIIDYTKKDNQITTKNIYDVIFILCGFVLIYIAGLLHSI